MKQAPGELINDHHLAVVADDVLVIFLVERIRFEQLEHRMNPVAALCIGLIDLVFLDLLLSRRQGLIPLEDADLCSDVREHKHVLVGGAGKKLAPFISQIDLMILFVDREVEVIVDLMHPLRLIPHVLNLRILHQFLCAAVREHLGKFLILGIAVIGTQEKNAGIVFLSLLKQLFCVGNNLGDKGLLGIDQSLNARFHFTEFLVVHIYRTADDQRRSGLINQYRVHFIDDCIVMSALHHIVGYADHIVAQIVEAEFVIGAVGDVRSIFETPA